MKEQEIRAQFIETLEAVDKVCEAKATTHLVVAALAEQLPAEVPTSPGEHRHNLTP
jgi:predicted glycosyltransferase